LFFRYPFRISDPAFDVIQLRVSHKNRAFQNLIFFAKILTQNQFSLIAYIIKSANPQKSKPCKMDLPLLKKDITRIFWT
jgi:hypothetical protein